MKNSVSCSLFLVWMNPNVHEMDNNTFSVVWSFRLFEVLRLDDKRCYRCFLLKISFIMRICLSSWSCLSSDEIWNSSQCHQIILLSKLKRKSSFLATGLLCFGSRSDRSGSKEKVRWSHSPRHANEFEITIYFEILDVRLLGSFDNAKTTRRSYWTAWSVKCWWKVCWDKAEWLRAASLSCCVKPSVVSCSLSTMWTSWKEPRELFYTPDWNALCSAHTHSGTCFVRPV